MRKQTRLVCNARHDWHRRPHNAAVGPMSGDVALALHILAVMSAGARRRSPPTPLRTTWHFLARASTLQGLVTGLRQVKAMRAETPLEMRQRGPRATHRQRVWAPRRRRRSCAHEQRPLQRGPPSPGPAEAAALPQRGPGDTHRSPSMLTRFNSDACRKTGACGKPMSQPLCAMTSPG